MCNIVTNIKNKSILKGLLRIYSKFINKEARLNATLVQVAFLRETFYIKLPEVKLFSKERKGNQPRLRK